MVSCQRWVTNVGSGLGTSPSTQALFAPLEATACRSSRCGRVKTLSVRQPDAVWARAGAAAITIAVPTPRAVPAQLAFRLMTPFYMKGSLYMKGPFTSL